MTVIVIWKKDFSPLVIDNATKVSVHKDSYDIFNTKDMKKPLLRIDKKDASRIFTGEDITETIQIKKEN